MKPDRIIDELFVSGGYLKWKNRSTDKLGIEYYNLFMGTTQLGKTSLCCWTNQVLARRCTYTVTLLYIDLFGW